MPIQISAEGIVFWKGLSMMVEAGLPLIKVLDLVRRSAGEELENVVSDIKDMIEKGGSIANAMEKHGEVFSAFEIEMVRIGEMSGTLGNVTGKIAKTLIDLSRSVKGKEKAERIVFWRFLSELIGTGIPFIQALDISRRSAGEELKNVVSDIKDMIEKGGSPSHAMEKHGELFSVFEIGMARMGEETGTLSEMAGFIAETLVDVSFPVKGKEELTESTEEPEPPVVELVNSILRGAVNDGASDIHIEPLRERTRVRYRIHGVLREVMDLPQAITHQVISRIKLMSGMDITEERVPQDGQITPMVTEGEEFYFNVTTFPSLYGESITLRDNKRGSKHLTLAELGITPETNGDFYEVLHLPQGLILITGPTGSGKSTTMYAALNEVDVPSKKVLTVEDEIWSEIPGAIRGIVRSNIGFTYASMLRSVLRNDPDVILVGELRDEETVTLTMEAALTGHFVLSVLHANDATSSLIRLLDTGIKPFLVAEAVRAVLAQRLVPKLCPECKQAVEPSEELRQIFTECQIGVPNTVYSAVGCNACEGGYKGRIAIHELLIMNEEIKRLVLLLASSQEIRSAARKAGMRTLRENGMEKVASGITTAEQILLATPVD